MRNWDGHVHPGPPPGDATGVDGTNLEALIKIRYFGHIIRADKIQKTLLTGKVEGKRGRGRPRRTWASDIEQWTQRSMSKCVREAHNRDQWRYLSANLPEVVATNR